MLKKHSFKKEKSLNLHKDNQFTQVKEPTVLKAVITLKPKPVELVAVEEPVVFRKKKAYEVKNERVKFTPKVEPIKVVLPKHRKAHVLRSEEFLVELKKAFPIIAQNYPLEIGVAKKLYDLYPDTARRIINTAMYIHTHNELYVEFLSKGMGRFDLKGTFVSSTNSEGQELASALLAEIRRNKKKIVKKRLK